MKGLRTVTVLDALAQTLRDRVLDGDIAPGSALPETEVAEEYDVSRPTAKAAINELVQAGLLRRETHRTAYVPRLTRADVEDLFLVRIPLELEVVHRLVAHGQVPPGAAVAVQDLAEVAADGPHSVFVEADLRFHRELVDVVASPRLSRLYGILTGEIHLSMVQSRYALGRDRIVAEHSAVLAALRDRNEPDAALRMRQHLEGARDALGQHLGAQSSG